MSPPRPKALVVFKALYWAAAFALPPALLFGGPWREEMFRRMTEYPPDILGIAASVYLGGAAVLYRLLLRFAWLATDHDAVDQEIRDSEGRIELNLRDPKP